MEAGLLQGESQFALPPRAQPRGQNLLPPLASGLPPQDDHLEGQEAIRLKLVVAEEEPLLPALSVSLGREPRFLAGQDAVVVEVLQAEQPPRPQASGEVLEGRRQVRLGEEVREGVPQAEEGVKPAPDGRGQRPEPRHHEADWHSDGLRMGPRPGHHLGAQVCPHHLVPTLGQGHGMPAGATSGIQDSPRAH